MPRAFVGLGSNLGDREATILAAVAELDATDGIAVVGVSSLIDTEPVGNVDQPRFLNGVAALETSLPARELLGLLLAVEARFGRDVQGRELAQFFVGDSPNPEPALRPGERGASPGGRI